MTYFHRVHAATPTRVWVNNPTLADAHRSIADGAIACTTNPTYASKELTAEPDVARAAIDAAICREKDDSAAADLVQRELCARLMGAFLPVYEKSPAQAGFVSIQSDPLREDEAGHIIESARAYRGLGPNYIAKIPVTRAGLAAIKILAAEGYPLIATEIMSTAQALETCRVWTEATQRLAVKPALYITHITGILEEYLLSVNLRDGLGLSPETISAACIAAAHEQYRVVRALKIPARMLGGGARTIEHFTGMVGLDMDVTINWKGTADSLLAADPAIAPAPVSDLDAVKTVLETMPDFRLAWDECALSVDRFETFGPVVLFRSMFVAGWQKVIDAVRDRRKS